MPQFPRRNTQPMRADSYRRIARLLRGLADKIDRYAGQIDPHHKTAMTRLLDGLHAQSRDWRARHHATRDGTLHVPPRPLGGGPDPQ